jgi:aspartate-semialdehyde dehydrogenase
MDDGFTKEEWKMMVETKKILDPKIRLTATCVRVPVFVGHSESINIEFENELSAADAQARRSSAWTLELVSNSAGRHRGGGPAIETSKRSKRRRNATTSASQGPGESATQPTASRHARKTSGRS